MRAELEEKIKNARLTRVEKKVADYILENSESLYFLTAKDIAQQLDVSDASVIRLCRSLGYKGYKDLQESMRGELSQALRQDRYIIPPEQISDKFDRYRALSSYQYLEMAIENLQSTCTKNEPEKFAAAAELILSSERVMVAGFRGAASLALHLGVTLSQLIENVSYLTQADSRCVEAVLDYSADDCIILAGAERYSRMTRVLSEMARENGCRIITITDKITAPIAKDADIVFLADFSSPIALNSYVGALYVAETIAIELSKKLGIRPRQRLSRMNKYLSELQLF